MPQYSLCQHVYMCTTRDYVVFLDIDNDTYLGLSLTYMDAVGCQLRGWRRASPEHGDRPHSEERAAKAALEDLTKGKILTLDSTFGKDVATAAGDVPTAALIETIFINTLLGDETTPEPKVRVQDVWNFSRAYVAAARMRRWWPLGKIVRHVQARKQGRVSSHAHADIALAREPVWVFRRVRPFFFSKKGACFFESLVLLEFLAHYGLFPTWVFGIKTAPFRAHCWVQDGSVVFNDSHHLVRCFTPIMAV